MSNSLQVFFSVKNPTEAPLEFKYDSVTYVVEPFAGREDNILVTTREVAQHAKGYQPSLEIAEAFVGVKAAPVQQEVVTCPVCGFQTGDLAVLNSHLTAHLKGTDKPAGDTPIAED